MKTKNSRATSARNPAPGFRAGPFNTRIEVERARVLIVLSEQAYQEQRYAVHLCPHEVAWLGAVEELGPDRDYDQRFRIDQTIFVRQKVTPVKCTLHERALALLGTRLLHEGPEGEALLNRLKYIGHSHVDMAVESSGEDLEFIEMVRRTDPPPWYIRGILNKRGQAKYTFFDFQRGVTIYDVPWVREEPDDPAAREKIAGELAANVKFSGLSFDWNPLKADPPLRNATRSWLEGGSHG